MDGHPIDCDCTTCSEYFADADAFAKETFSILFVDCKRPGCDHNNCLMVGGVCAGSCECARGVS